MRKKLFFCYVFLSQTNWNKSSTNERRGVLWEEMDKVEKSPAVKTDPHNLKS